MSSKEFLFDENLHAKIIKGANTLADSVCVTLGPKGRNVILKQKGKNPFITKDGATVAKFVDLPDEFENLGAQIIKQAAETTNSTAGDGTTTSTVLARSILKEGQRAVSAGCSPYQLKAELDEAAEQAVAILREHSKPVSSFADLENIATISANGDRTIGKLIAKAIEEVGKHGSVTIKEGRSLTTDLKIEDGFRFDSGLVSSIFVNDPKKNSAKFDDPYFLVTDHKLESIFDLNELLEKVAKDNKPLVIIADDVSGQLLATFSYNVEKGILKGAVVKAPKYGEERRKILEDIALATGATFVGRETNIQFKHLKLTDLGQSESVEISQSSTVIVNGVGQQDLISERIDFLKEELSKCSDRMMAERIQERINRLISAVAIIYVGAATESEMIEKKHRIEDALEAVNSAQHEGILPGGGVSLIYASRCLKASNQTVGGQVLSRALEEPLRQLLKNAGKSYEAVVEKLEESFKTDSWVCYDLYDGTFKSAFASGIIDPTKVARCALQNATSAAGMLLTTGCAIVEK